jgi:hypothetical protein
MPLRSYRTNTSRHPVVLQRNPTLETRTGDAPYQGEIRGEEEAGEMATIGVSAISAVLHIGPRFCASSSYSMPSGTDRSSARAPCSVRNEDGTTRPITDLVLRPNQGVIALYRRVNCSHVCLSGA